MGNKIIITKTLLLLAALVCCSASTVGYRELTDTKAGAFAEPRPYHFDFDNVQKGPYLNLKSALLVNYDNGEVLYAKNADKVRPIASISKLVTAMVALDEGLDLTKETETITREDARRSSKSSLYRGWEFSLMDLMHAMLISSDNRAARALARGICGSQEAFVQKMNKKVVELGLTRTFLYEPSGLDSRNVSTATEVAKILQFAHDYKVISSITSKRTHRAKILNRKNRQRSLGSTNRLLWSSYEVLIGKTGYIQAADYCLTSLVENRDGEKLTLVVLGVPGERLRFREAQRLLKWGFKKVS